MLLAGTTYDKLTRYLEKAIAQDRADMGNIQYYDTDTGTLSIVAQKGFNEGFISYFSEVKPFDSSACGRAFGSGGPITIGNVATDKAFAKHLTIARQAGFCAVKSIPLFHTDSRANRRQVGVLSTHFKEVKTHWDFTLLDDIVTDIARTLSLIKHAEIEAAK